jgi:hypothetical protein
MPEHPFHGRSELRGLTPLMRSSFPEGRFGRMFRNLRPLLPPGAALEALARQMFEPEPQPGEEDDPAKDNPDLPAGFTYFGQFVDHDLTFDPTSQLQRDNDPNALHNFRTPAFDLDSIYGRGPDDQPFLYEHDGIHFLLGKNAAGEDDLSRNTKGRALLGDPRNDENLIVAQLTLGILKYHNQVVGTPFIAGLPEDQRFDEARRIVRWHFQWAVVHDFLARLVGNDVIDDILLPDSFKVPAGPTANTVRSHRVVRKFFHWKNHPFMPVEFAVGAYRFGHSMVRGEYELNAKVQNIPIFAKEPAEDLRGFRALPVGHVIEWARFFSFRGSTLETQPSRKIDSKLAFGLSILPGDVAKGVHDLAERDLKRGKALGLPSGQDIARAMGIPEDLILHEKDLSSLPRDLVKLFGEQTPLFFYVLKEAEVFSKGRRLGPVGGRIVAEVFFGLLQGDPSSYLRVQPSFRPKAGEFGAPRDGEFTVQDLLRFARVTIG